MTQREEGGNSRELEIRTVQGPEYRDEWGERVSSELGLGQCRARVDGRGLDSEPGQGGGSHGCTALSGPGPQWGWGGGGGRVLSL